MDAARVVSVGWEHPRTKVVSSAQVVKCLRSVIQSRKLTESLVVLVPGTASVDTDRSFHFGL